MNACEELGVQVAELKQKTLETMLELARRIERFEKHPWFAGGEEKKA